MPQRRARRVRAGLAMVCSQASTTAARAVAVSTVCRSISVQPCRPQAPAAGVNTVGALSSSARQMPASFGVQGPGEMTMRRLPLVGGEAGEDAPAGPEVGVAHVRALDHLAQREYEVAKGVCRHGNQIVKRVGPPSGPSSVNAKPCRVRISCTSVKPIPWPDSLVL